MSAPGTARCSRRHRRNRVKVILYDLGPEYGALIESKCDRAVAADGRYASCQGCFGCWTRHPAECFMKDSLQQICRVIGHADDFVIVTKNLYGAYSAAVKNVLDRSSERNTPVSCSRLLFSSCLPTFFSSSFLCCRAASSADGWQRKNKEPHLCLIL